MENVSEDADAKLGLEAARKDLEIDIAQREREAKEKLDEMLSDKNMQFCSRCGRKISSRTDWAGKCMWEGCENLICHDCWDVHKYKFCTKHTKNIVDEKEEDPDKKEVFGEEDGPEIKVDLKGVLDNHEESRISKLQYYASEFSRQLQKKMEQNGPIDWTPTQFVKKAKFRSEKNEGDYLIEVYSKKWFFKKTRLSILVTPYDSRGIFDENALNAYIHKEARKMKGYKIIVLVSEGAGIEMAHFVNKFSDSSFSLFLAEPKNGHLNFNIRHPLTVGYSDWFNQKKEALNFTGRLKKIGDVVSDRTVISEKAVAKEFGFDEKEVRSILKSCKFLDPVKDTDTYIMKKS